MSKPRNFIDKPIGKEESYYEVLGIEQDASLEEIKKAFRKI